MKKKIILVIAICVFLLRWQSWSIPLDRDEGAYAYIASNLFEKGFALYKDAFDHKPPGIYFIYNFAFQFFGKTQFAVRMMGFVNSVLGASLVYLILKKLKVDRSSILLSLAFFMFVSNSFVLDGIGSNTEIFMTTILGLALLLFVHFVNQKKVISVIPFIIGLLAGIAFLVKPVSIANVFFLLGWLLLFDRRRFIYFSLCLLSGAILPPLAVFYWLKITNVWPWFWQSAVLFNKGYFFGGFTEISSKMSYLAWLIRAPKIVQFFALILTGILIAERNRLKDKKLLLVFFWTLAYFVGAKLTTRDVHHYYYPFIQGLALSFAVIPRKLFSKKAVILGFLIFLILYGHLWLRTPRGAQTRVFGTTVRYSYEARSIAAEIKEKTKEDDRIFLWIDEPEILFYSRRRSTSRFINTFGLILPGAEDELRESLALEPFAVVSYGSQPDWLSLYLKENNFTIEKKYSIAAIYWRN